MFVAATLARWGVASGEPVLNAVEELTVLGVNASKPDLLGDAPHRLNTLYVRLMRLNGTVLVEVWDRNPVAYTLPELPGVVDKGYRLVEGGKAAWAAVAVADLAAAGYPPGGVSLCP
nr:hypothetical protein [Micromonospora sp. DSM 115978]